MRRYRFEELESDFLDGLCRRNPVADPDVMATCQEVFDAVSERGDEALREYTLRFDGVRIEELAVSPQEFATARSRISPDRVTALTEAHDNIRKFHIAQTVDEEPVQVQDGVLCWRESRPIEAVGLYVPGGSAVLPSTVLMLGVPARLAGCPTIQLCVPPTPQASVSDEVLVAAELAGIEKVFKVGGAQAIAAMSLGTESIARVDKITGPGNRWVQAAKLIAVLNGIAIDMVAGPTEVLVIADETALPEWVATDLISQAEHGADSQAILVSDSSAVIDQIVASVEEQLPSLPRQGLAREALENSFALVTPSLETALEFANAYAPEHLILHLEEASSWSKRVQSAGSVFVGAWSPEVAGDYASGTNHTLPTSGSARAVSGVSLDTFLKKITFQELTQRGLAGLATTLETLAEAEGLEGHRRAVSLRLGEAAKKDGDAGQKEDRANAG